MMVRFLISLVVYGVFFSACRAASEAVVDRFGQSVGRAYPGKVGSDDELKGDVAAQEAALRPAPDSWDVYGGLKGSGERLGLKRTGYFFVGRAGERQVLVTPDGNVFFQLGVCGISMVDDYTVVKGRENKYEWIPGTNGEFATAWRENTPGVFSFYTANWIRKYKRPWTMEEWSGQVVDRLRSWGFNSAGAFSTYTETMRKMGFPYASFLPISKELGVKMLPEKLGAAEVMDPFAPGAEETLDRIFAPRLAAKAGDPLLIGYFQGNEQHFELLPKLIPGYRASQVAAKARLVSWLEEKYKDISKFNDAWKPASDFADFAGLGDAKLNVQTEAAARDMHDFYRLFLEKYFEMIARVYRKYDKNHLLIGCRMTPGTANNRDVVEISGKYLDVLSVNYYSYTIEGDFLKQVHEWSGGRPLLLSEWYYGTTDRGLGGGKEVRDQAERAEAYRNYVEQAAALPFVVGSQWFIYNDQSITGRFFEGFHGEGNNTGLVDVADRPYEELVAAARRTGERVYDVMLGVQAPFLSSLPRLAGAAGKGDRVAATPRALPEMKFDGTTTGWPGRPAEPIEANRAVVGNVDPDLRGDFRLCWDAENLYFLIQVKDKTPGANDNPIKAAWSGDCVELFIGARDVAQTGSMIFSDRQLLVRVGKEPKIYVVEHDDEAERCPLLVAKDVVGEGYVAQVTIPWKILGVEPKAGMEILFDVGIDNSDDGRTRRQQLMWNGTSRNAGDRGGWGRIRLTDN